METCDVGVQHTRTDKEKAHVIYTRFFPLPSDEAVAPYKPPHFPPEVKDVEEITPE
jgi:hypothetical protein